jgi:hypothetical protein
MSKRITIKGFIAYHTASYWRDDERFCFTPFDPRKSTHEHEDRVVVQEHAIEVDVPADFDPRPQQVAMLVAEKQRINAAFAARITELDAQINKLLALEAS